MTKKTSKKVLKESDKRLKKDVLSNPHAKLEMSDLVFRKTLDTDAYNDLGRDDMFRWELPNVACIEDGEVVYHYVLITQFLDRPGGSIGGYQAYVDKAFPIGDSPTLEGAKRIIVDRVNKLRDIKRL